MILAQINLNLIQMLKLSLKTNNSINTTLTYSIHYIIKIFARLIYMNVDKYDYKNIECD